MRGSSSQHEASALHAKVHPDELPMARHHHSLPVTALESYHSPATVWVLAGSGTVVQVFQAETARLYGVIQAFAAQTIHGITHWRFTNSRAEELSAIYLVWGGRSLRVMEVSYSQVSDSLDIRNLSEEVLVGDWILDVHCLSRTGSSRGRACEALILSSHNVVQLLSFRSHLIDGFDRAINVVRVAVGPTSMLYSAHITTVNGHQVFIASGTIFGEVLLWTFWLAPSSKAAKTETARLLQAFHGHEGSVFGVQLLNFPAPNSSQTPLLIASCSDDRTIRLWGHSETEMHSQRAPFDNGVNSTGETGFSGTTNRGHDRGVSIATAMGHVSRIWSLKSFSPSLSSLRLMTFGEDGTTQLWRVEDNSLMEKPGSQDLFIEHEFSNAYHTGKNIWASTLIHREEPSGPRVVTGGADGRIILYDLNGQNSSFSVKNIQIPMDALLEEAHDTITSPTISNGKLQSPTWSLFQNMLGEWVLYRTIKSKLSTYPSGIFRGSATITPRDSSNEIYNLECLYEEEGSLTTEQGLTFRGTRRYVYRYQERTDTISAWFVKPESKSTVDYLFHEVKFKISHNQAQSRYLGDQGRCFTAQGHHLCIDDDYDAEYEFRTTAERLERWSIKYQVIGPKKDYTLNATYTQKPKDSLNKFVDKSITESPTDGKEPRAENSQMEQAPVDNELKSYCWQNGTQLLVTTNAGYVARATLTEKGRSSKDSLPLLTTDLEWEYIAHSLDLVTQSLMVEVDSCDAVLLTGKSGTIYRVSGQLRLLEEVIKLPSKVTSLFVERLHESFESSSILDTARSVGVVASCVGMSSAIVFRLSIGKQDEARNQVALTETRSLDLPTNTIVTSACWLGIASRKKLLLGTRNGALLIFSDPHSTRSQDRTLFLCIHRVHVEDSITVIQNVPPAEHGMVPFLLTAGRDGRYAIHRWLFDSRQQGEISGLETVHEGEPPFGPNIEGAMFDRTAKDLILWGFKGRHFIVWNESKERELMEIDCGGAHRNWAYHRGHNSSEGGKLIWTQASACHLRVQPEPSHRVLRAGSHGREIKAVAACPRDEGGHLIATGAEDTTIRIAKYNHHADMLSEPFEHLGMIRKHRTGIQQLQWSPGGQHLFSAGGYEELYVWRVQCVPAVGIGITRCCQCPPVSESCDLRVTDFDIHVEEIGASEVEVSFIIGAVYSDSTVRVWRCRTQDVGRGFELLHSGVYTTCCLTQIKMTCGESSLITAGTDGYVALWYIPATSTLQDASRIMKHDNDQVDEHASLAVVTRHKVHQSTIKAMAVLSAFPDIVLVTGGDDNALAFTRIETRLGKPAPYRCSTLLIPSAHASAINAVQCLRDHTSSDQNRETSRTNIYAVISTGNDQKIKQWSVTTDLERPGVKGLQVRRVSDRNSSVADASCMALISGRDTKSVAVAGVGLEVWVVAT